MGYIVERIAPRHRVECKEYRREFTLVGERKGNGYSFPCERNGELIKDQNYEYWIDNYKYCIEHPEKYIDEGIVEEKWSYMESELVRCSCGEELYLEGDTVCDCGQWYNGFGQALKDPSFWEEDMDEYDY